MSLLGKIRLLEVLTEMMDSAGAIRSADGLDGVSGGPSPDRVDAREVLMSVQGENCSWVNFMEVVLLEDRWQVRWAP